VIVSLHKNFRLEKFETAPLDDLIRLYEIIEEAYQESYDKVKAESDKVAKGFNNNDIVDRIILHNRRLNNNHVARTVPYEDND
jgi:hypothetical protein